MTDGAASRRRGLSIRLRLTLSYVGFLLAAWAVFLVVAAFVLRFVPVGDLVVYGSGAFVPDRGDLLAVAWPVAVAGTVGLAAVGLGGGWWLAGRMLRPVDDIAAAVRAAAAGSLRHRVDVPGPDDELRSLADNLNVMLARLERTFDEQQRFTRNASHELRTPLTITKTVLDVARADPAGRDVDLLFARLTEVNARAIDTVEALLRLAGAGGARVPDDGRDSTDLADVVRQELASLHDATPVTPGVDQRLAPAPVVGDGPLLHLLVANLLANAVRHNLAADGDIAVRTCVDDTGASVLHVENTGPVVTAEQAATFVEPFVRGAGRVRSGRAADGSGLGLSIVDSVARAHGATLDLRPRPGGGLCVSVRFGGRPPPLSASRRSSRSSSR